MTAETPRLLPVAELNLLSLDEFAVALRPLVESASPLARALYAERPYHSYLELLNRAESIASELMLDEQIDVLNAHPRIGESAATVRNLSSLSYREQGYDREASLQAEDLERVYATLNDLNRAYEDRFGFRFVVFVNERPKSAIVDVLRERLRNSRDAELQTAMREMFSIARDRYARLA